MTSPEPVLRLIVENRVAAHNILFRHRHSAAPAPFHPEIIEAFHSDHPRVVCEAFRGAAKSTIAEEATVLAAALMEFSNGLVIGANHSRACERLLAIRTEFEMNEDLAQAFGQLRGTVTWGADKIVLANGVCIQALGAGQSLRGIKHLDKRPDWVLIDDLEDEDSVRSPQAREQMLRWLYASLIPALDPKHRIRFIGNRLDPQAVLVKVATDASWKHLAFPIKRLDVATGEEIATWPARFPLEKVHELEAQYRRFGLIETFQQEYMCEAEAPEARIFRPEHFAGIVQPRVRTWEATWAMVDPGRSVQSRAATSAIAVWSWIGPKLVVWDCKIARMLPSELIDEMIAVDREYMPVAIGVEQDTLNEFIMQPLRQAQVKYGQPLPLRALAAKAFTEGRGKIDFIQSLQPFFAAKEIIFAKEMPLLEEQFRSFPRGQIDGPNALAYSLKMRPGLPVYDEFTSGSVFESIMIGPGQPWLALNATRAVTTGALVQYDGVGLRVLADFVEEGEPGQAAGMLIRRAQVEAGGKAMRLVAPPLHLDHYHNVGLRAAIARIPAELGVGGDPLAGRNEIRQMLRLHVKGLPSVQVARSARWTLNAFAGGYARKIDKHGRISDDPEDNVYATLMGGLESFAALMQVSSGANSTDELNWRTSADGRRYRSAMVNRRER